MFKSVESKKKEKEANSKRLKILVVAPGVSFTIAHMDYAVSIARALQEKHEVVSGIGARSFVKKCK